MFVHKQRLQHLLKPHHYTTEAHFQREQQHIFQPGWHLAAVKPELPRSGDFVTRELFGQPLLLRNFDGDVRAFLNVCAHRHCLISGLPQGTSPTLRCQYHGWEYTKEGRTGKIPDAGCFRPWDREHAQLRVFRTETVGELIFVSLADDGPSLRDYLGSYYEYCQQFFGTTFRFSYKWRKDYAANWKLPVENTLEAYHIPCLHQSTFGDHPSEENSHHTLAADRTTLQTPEPPSLARTMQNWLVRRLGAAPTNIYTHHHIHPNLVFISLDVMRMVQVFVPTSATTAYQQVYMYTLRGKRGGPVRYLLGQNLRGLVSWVSKKILTEDAPIFEQLQRGLQASVHPGVIGTLEERLYIFQKWILDRCGESLPQLPEERNGHGTLAAAAGEDVQ